ncbi:MAG: hypothetical protein NTW78_06065 [Campylobacterales bacterium]|nr:hypothetical protein [Campylobacterales bacterium]
MMKALLLLLLSIALYAGTCANYVQEVRRYHYAEFGVDFPYQYAIGQLQQESGCRNVISIDGVGSEGVSQITFKVWKIMLIAAGINDIKAVGNQLRAQAIIMHSLHNPKQGLWVTYQKYNGGGLVLKEINRAGIEDWQKAKDECKRGQSCFTYKGKTTCRSNCEINYDYSQKIYKYGGEYGSVQSTQFRYW